MGSDTPTLFGTPKRRGRGRHERRMDAALVTAKDDGLLAPVNDGLVAVLRALARALDEAELDGSPYAVATVARELRAALDTARMTPSGPSMADPFADLMAGLADDHATS